jgi:hypothetical protein
MNRTNWIVIAAALLTNTAVPQQTPPTPATTAPVMSAEVYVIAPKDGAPVHSPVTVRFGLKGAGIAPAGVKFDNTGHHHLLVDTDLTSLKLDAPLPASDKIVHFGKGQTETELKLEPGKHTLQLLFADYSHTPFSPVISSKKITITVVQ